MSVSLCLFFVILSLCINLISRSLTVILIIFLCLLVCVCMCVSLSVCLFIYSDITQEFNEIIQQKEAKDLNVNTKGKNDCYSSIKRIISPAFGKPFMVIGIMHTLTSLGVYIILLFNMINIFKEAQSSVEPQLAPVFVDIVQVGLMLVLCKS
jgi:hypothetical protein